jgi:phosphotransferase system HPr-like phosphotransfer protein
MKMFLPTGLEDRDVAKIVHLANSTTKQVTARSDRWVVSAKSLLGMIALVHEGQLIELESESDKVIELIAALF